VVSHWTTTIAFTFALVSSLNPAIVPATTYEIRNEAPAAQKPSRPDILRRIAVCESGDRHFDRKGAVIRGAQNVHDVGRYQINLYYHREAAERLGLDLFDEQDNETYALHLYAQSGTKPWKWSEHCWNSDARR